MSIYSIRQRWGMGPKVDPHFDARVGRIAAMPANAGGKPSKASGYVELDGEDPWGYLQEMLAALYAEKRPQGIAGEIDGNERPLAWTQITGIRYLTTDPGCGVALPMHAFMPPPLEGAPAADRQAALEDAIARLRAATDDRLKTARLIGLTVGFQFDLIGQQLRAAFHPGLWQPFLLGRPKWAQENVHHVLCGGTKPASPLHMLFGAAARRPFRAQKLGLASCGSPQLSNAMRVLRTHAPPALPDYGIPETGRGAIVGIVDFGCDFAHPSFIDAAKGSRILALWDQNDGDGARPIVKVGQKEYPFGYGRLFTDADINRALAGPQPGDAAAAADPYALLKYDPHENHYAGSSAANDGAHGTFVMEVAAGGPRTVGAGAPRGVAPEADIVFVHVRERTHGDLRVLDMNDVVDAVAFVFHVAESRQQPCVVNLSLNTMSGPHDGDGYFDRRLASLLRSGSAGAEARGRAVVIAAGNLPANQVQKVRWQHLGGEVEAGTPLTFFWRMAAQDSSRNMVEIWYDATDAWLQVTLVSPEGGQLGPVRPGRAAEVMEGSEWRGSVIGSRLMPKLRANDVVAQDGVEETDETAGRHVILLQLDAMAPSEVQWKVILEVAPGTQQAPPEGARVKFDAWLERDDQGPSGLSRHHPAQDVHALDKPCTIGTLSCGEDAIVVGAYSTFNANEPQPWGLSGHGPTRRGDLRKPDLAAPGHHLELVRSRGGHQVPVQVAPSTGTSFAAPFVTGTIAGIYQLDPRATLADVRRALTETARPMPGMPAGWTSDLGHGCLDPAAVLDRFRPKPTTP